MLAGFRQWIPEAHINDPVKSLVTALPLDLEFKTKGELAIGIFDDAVGDGLSRLRLRRRGLRQLPETAGAP